MAFFQAILQSTRGSGPAMSKHADAARDDAPHLEALSIGNSNVRKGGIFGLQPDRAILDPVALHGEGAIVI